MHSRGGRGEAVAATPSSQHVSAAPRRVAHGEPHAAATERRGGAPLRHVATTASQPPSPLAFNRIVPAKRQSLTTHRGVQSLITNHFFFPDHAHPPHLPRRPPPRPRRRGPD